MVLLVVMILLRMKIMGGNDDDDDGGGYDDGSVDDGDDDDGGHDVGDKGDDDDDVCSIYAGDVDEAIAKQVVCSFAEDGDASSRLMEIGDEFCGSRSEGLEESIRKQSVNYFRSYHRSRMDELRMFLENEGWELCPVKSGFTIMMLQVMTRRFSCFGMDGLGMGGEGKSRWGKKR